MESAHFATFGGEPATCGTEVIDFIFFGNVERRAFGGDGAAAAGHPQPPTSSQLLPSVRLEILGALAPPSTHCQPELLRGLGSDHVPIVADFAFVAPSRRRRLRSSRGGGAELLAAARAVREAAASKTRAAAAAQRRAPRAPSTAPPR
eukprot:TRINITY_DN9845_c0_g1_i1.p2 TRINITY_DN9845_c0_g1~~TRINITY_DN9845_c0_g1_i1.p2  ORF type:complete len:148 (+),score=33.29 TRINITY_DN9845_c0_g1_i1:2-445(+)